MRVTLSPPTRVARCAPLPDPGVTWTPSPGACPSPLPCPLLPEPLVRAERGPQERRGAAGWRAGAEASGGEEDVGAGGACRCEAALSKLYATHSGARSPVFGVCSGLCGHERIWCSYMSFIPRRSHSPSPSPHAPIPVPRPRHPLTHFFLGQTGWAPGLPPDPRFRGTSGVLPPPPVSPTSVPWPLPTVFRTPGSEPS